MSSVTPAAPVAEPEGAPAAPHPKGNGRFILVAVVGLVLVGGLGAGGWLLYPRLFGKGPGAPAAVKHEEPVKATAPLGSVVVNIGRPDSRRYLKVGVELGLATAKDVKEMEETKARVLDLLITVLSTTPMETLSEGEKRGELKQALLERIHKDLGLTKVRQVYFTEFMIQ
jgi:flagellar basal body-associated protein FliL